MARPATASKKVLDPLFAQVLYLKDAKGTGFVLVSFDLIGMSHELSEKIRLDIVHELGVPFNLVVLNTSHTHSGPYMIRSLMAGVGPAPEIEIEYFKTLEQKIISATRAAAKAMTPVKVEIFDGTSQVAINRRGKNKKGETAMLPNANAPFDEKLWVMKLTPENGSSPAVIFSYACHPVLAYGFNFSAISADFPGVARNVLREKLGEKVHAQFVQGLAGDVRPRVVADLKKNGFRAPTPADLQKAGTDLANDVLAALKNKGEILSLNIAGAGDRPFLPRDKPPERETYKKMHDEGAAKTNKFFTAVSEYWLSCYDSGFGFAKGDAWPVGLIRLAENQWVCYFAGEPCVEWRAKISQWLPGKKFVPWGYCLHGDGRRREPGRPRDVDGGARQILATGPVLDASSVAFNAVALEPFMVKGKKDPVHAFMVGHSTGSKPRPWLGSSRSSVGTRRWTRTGGPCSSSEAGGARFSSSSGTPGWARPGC